MRIAACLGLPADQLRSLYYALLLKDVGCSSNAARMCQIIGGDDRAVKAGVKLEDWTQPNRPKFSTLSLMWNTVLPGSSAFERVLRIGKIAATQHSNNEEMISLRCDRGASVVRKLGLDNDTAEAVRNLDEHWDGSGYPERRRAVAIPLLARICAIAQHLDVFATERGQARAIDVLRHRSGRWYDPDLVRVACSLHAGGSLWMDCLNNSPEAATRRLVLDLAPPGEERLDNTRTDLICEAFAEVVDAKSPFTYRHSIGVAVAADAIAEEMSLSAERRALIHRASLLHDLGKLSVSNSILDKPGKLTPEEWQAVQGHPGLTFEILRRIPAFRQVALIAGQHHEKLDGSGYPHRRMADELSLESRILTVADIYGALAEERPYREGLPLEKVLSILQSEVPHKLDPECFEALRALLLRGQKAVPEATPVVWSCPPVLSHA